MLFSNNLYDKLKTECESLISHDSSYLEAYYYRGLVAFVEKDWNTSLTNFEKVVTLADTLNPYRMYALLYSSIAFSAIGFHNEALDTVSEALKMNPFSLGAHRAKAEALFGLGRFDEAIKSFDKALTLTSEGEELQLQFLRKRAYILQFYVRRIDEALSDLNIILRYHPMDRDARRKKGLILRDLKMYEEALNFYKETLSMFPQDFETFLQKGDVLMKLERYTEALETYEKALFTKEPLAGSMDIHSFQTGLAQSKIDQLNIILAK